MPGSSVTFTDTALAAGATWHYRVRTDNGVALSAPGPVASATTWPAFEVNAARGTWTGLILPAGNFEHARSGAAWLSVNARGAFSGSLLVGGRRVTMRGQFTAGGGAAGTIRTLPAVADAWALAFDTRTGEVTGALTLGGAARATLRLVRAATWTRLDPCPHRGAYTLLLQPDPDDAASPPGVGFGRVSIGATGLLVFSGMLPDRTSISQSVWLPASGEWPLCINLCAGAGGLLGWVPRDPEDRLGSPPGPLRWTKPPTGRGAAFRSGFSVETALAGGRYVPAPGIWSGGGSPVETRLTFNDSAAPALPAPVTAMLDARTRLSFPAGANVAMTITPGTGLFSGTFRLPGDRRVHVFRGAIVQGEDAGGGYFFIGNEGGTVLFERVVAAPGNGHSGGLITIGGGGLIKIGAGTQPLGGVD